jgi:hypothetical protein
LVHKKLKIQQSSYLELCQQIMTILQNVLSTLSPLALNQEPEDCVNAFQDFIIELLHSKDVQLDTTFRQQVDLKSSRNN